MEDKNEIKDSNDDKSEISISLIKKTIEKLIKDDNKKDENINSDIIKLIEKFDCLFQKNKFKNYFFIKLQTFSKFIDSLKDIEEDVKKNDDIEIENLQENTICAISISFLRININEKNHQKIREYLKILLILFIIEDITVNCFLFILEVILKSIMEIIKNKSSNQIKMIDIMEEPLLIINDIIESVVNLQLVLMKNDDFIENLIVLFNEIFENFDGKNFIVKKNVIWLKLLSEISPKDSFDLLDDESYKGCIEKITEFLLDIYKENIPKNFYGEIFKRSSIDFIYYYNVVNIITELIKTDLNKSRKVELDKGVYLLGTEYKKRHLSIGTFSNELSIVFPFQILGYKTQEVSLFHLYQKDNIIHLFVKNNSLNININKDFKWNTNIKINNNIFYFLCILWNKKKLEIYVNYDENSKERTKDKKYENKSSSFPKFGKDMDLIIGDENLSAIFGDIFFLNKEMEVKHVKLTFNSKGFYNNLIIRNNLNCDLTKNIIFSEHYEEAVRHFKSFKYDYNLIFTPNYFLSKDNGKNSLYEYYKANNYIEFINSNGIDFLTLMLHNIESKITDVNIFSEFLQQTLEILACILDRDNIKESDYVYELDKDNFKNQLNIFFMTLISILKPEQEEKKTKYFGTLSDEVWNSLSKIFSFDSDFNNAYYQIILSILLDTQLFEQKKFISQINYFFEKIKINEVNDELIYKILMLDFIFESETINHKSYLNVINAICLSKNKSVCKTLIKYAISLKSHVKIYHYFKIFYRNIYELKKLLSKEIKTLYRFVDENIESYDYFHCKYCSYMIVLCYLIKDDILKAKDQDKDDVFNFRLVNYMTNPSYLFLRCIFISNFNLPTKVQKLKFIKSKGKKSVFNFDVFKLVKFHPFELYDIKRFLVRFNSILKYIEFLLSLEPNENLKNIFDYFFPFILEFAEKIKDRYSDNIFIKEEDDKFVNEFYSSKEFTNFFILYFKCYKEKAMKEIKKFINISFFKYTDPFYFRILSDKCDIIKDENNITGFKNEIIKNILMCINTYKEKLKEKNWDNIFLFLILINDNFCQKELKRKMPVEFPNLILNLFNFLSDKNLLMHTNLINTSYYKNPNELDNKLVCEVILNIILNFYSKGFYKSEMIKSLLMKKNSPSSIFYIKDESRLKNLGAKNKKEKDDDYECNTDDDEEEEKNTFQESIDEFAFCLYFLIYFFEKEAEFKGDDKKNLFKSLLETLFNDLKTLYYINKKLPNHLKRIKTQGKIFDIYNEMIEICNKRCKDSDFNLEFLNEKYIQILNQINNEKENKLNEVNKEKEKDKDKNDLNNNNKNDSETDRYSQNNISENEININRTSNNNRDSSNRDSNSINRYSREEKNTIKEETNLAPERHIIEQLKKIDINNFYLEKISEEKKVQDTIKILCNPKGNYIWNKFTIFFKDLVFSNKKFKKVQKTFNIHLKNTIIVRKYKYKDKNNFNLSYPTKIKNYITDEYIRPFLKPCLNFFKSHYLNISHKYINFDLLKDVQYKEDNFNLINFGKIIPKSGKEKEKIFCELFKNKGNIFGYIQLNEKYFMFKNSPNDDTRSSEDPEKRFPYLFSINDDKIIDTDKYVIISYNDIKEIIKRRVCLAYIGVEIFLKDNKSYMFNFFDKINLNKFIEEVKKYSFEKNKVNKNVIIPNEDNHKHKDKNAKTPTGNNNNNNNNNGNNIQSINDNLENEIGIKFRIIEDPISEFKKLGFKSRNKKGELSNFNYLLFINKYSSRTYNDYNQYLVFPLLFMDEENKRKRDLTKAICLNKLNNKASYDKTVNNYSFFKYHFNQHYSTGGFILYYLVRLIPFTYQHIQFQSMKFDVPARIFSSMKNTYLFYEVTEDNRELIPEFYSDYDFLINLNYNDFGILEANEENYHLNNVDIFCEYSFPEYIIKSRNYLEETDLSPWIDNIFGAKQTTPSSDPPNLFPLNSYEEYSRLEQIKESDKSIEEKIGEITEKIDLFKFGMSPAKIFWKLHDKMGKKNHEVPIDPCKLDDSDNAGKKKKKDKKEGGKEKKDDKKEKKEEKREEKMLYMINKCIQKKLKEKVLYFYINNRLDDEIEIIFKFTNRIDFFRARLGEPKSMEFSIKIQEQIEFEPYSNSFFEIFPSTFCTVRHIDNTIAFSSTKKILNIFPFNCLITAVENKTNRYLENKVYKDIKEFFIGDEKGFLHLIEVKYDINQSEKSFEIKGIKIKRSVKAHERYIKGLLHNERLNIIFSWSDGKEGYLCMNNDYSLDFINIINIGVNNEIKEILVSKYNLLFLSCHNEKEKEDRYKILSYTLNGIPVSSYGSREKIVKCFMDEKFNVVHMNNNSLSFDLYSFDNISKCFYIEFTKDYRGWKIKINYCQYYPKIKKYLMINDDCKAYFYENKKDSI